MTLSTSTSRVAYSTNGTVGPFAIPFYFLASSHLAIVYTTSAGVETSLVLDTDYTVTGAGDSSGGTVTTTTAYPAGGSLTIIRSVPITQEADYTDQDAFAAESHEDALDKLTMIVQQLDERLDRALVMSTATTGSGELPTIDDRKNKYLSFDSAGNVTATAPSIGTALELAADLLAAGATDGAAMVGFLQAGVGATNARKVQDKLRDIVSVKDFGATGDGVTDDTTAMQAAHTTGALVYYPAGTYKFTKITMTTGGIVGDGQTLTVLSSTDATSDDLIGCTGASVGGPGNALTFRDFMLSGTLDGGVLAKAAGAGIAVKPSANENSYAYFSNVTVAYVPIGIDFVRASLWTVMGCKLLAYDHSGIRVANANNNDSGDSVIMGCAFSTPFYGGDNPAGVRQLSSGGLKIVGNKFLGGNYGYFLQYTDSAGDDVETGILQIANNSIENFYTNALSFTRVTAGLAAFSNVVIVNNEIAVALADPTANLISSDAAGFLQVVTITGNVLQLPGVTNSYGITLEGVTGLFIGNNVFRGNGGTSQAIGLTSCVDAKIGTNVYSNITTPYTIVTPGAKNSVVLDTQSGTTTTSDAGWTAYYGTDLYISATKTVTFDQAFQVVPSANDVSFSLPAGDGSLAGVVVAVSKTQLQLAVIASRTGIAAAINWKVHGVL